MFGTVSNKDQPMAAVLLVLLFDTLFYALLAYYLDSLFPGKYGVAKPWHFIFKVQNISI